MASFFATMILLVTIGVFVWRLSSLFDGLFRFGHDTYAKLGWKH